MRTKKFTHRQLAILDFMQRHLVEFQGLPTIREIATAFGIQSPNGVVGHLQALARHGAIVRFAKRKGSYRLQGVAIYLETTCAPWNQGHKTLSRRSAATNLRPQEESPNSMTDNELAVFLTPAVSCA